MATAGAFLPPRMESELLCPSLKAPSHHSHSRHQHLLGGSIENSSRGDFPGGPGLKIHLQCKEQGSIPGWGTKIPPASGQLGLCPATTEPTHHTTRESTCRNKDPAQPNKQIRKSSKTLATLFDSHWPQTAI